MPRPPVRPEDRRRVARACTACKASKKRCDGAQPCGPCSRKSLASNCRYNRGCRGASASLINPSSGRTDPSPVRDGRSRSDATWPPPWATGGSFRDAPESPPEALRQHPRPVVPENAPAVDAVLDSSSVTRSSSQQPAVMLSSSSGEKVFVGDTAAISFLRFLQCTLKRHVGSSIFTDDRETHKLFEAADHSANAVPFQHQIDLGEEKVLARAFLDASSGIFDLFSDSELEDIVAPSWAKCSSARHHDQESRLASRYCIVAIGAQCRAKSPMDTSTAACYFAEARKLAFGKMLQDPTLDLVRAFLLMAFYMLGACRRNSAFMYIGVASKAADILGLHVSVQQRHLSTSERDARIRTSRSLRVLDVVCSSILGRRSSAMPLSCKPSDGVENQGNPLSGSGFEHRAIALRANYDLAAIIDAAVTKSAEGGLDTAAAEGLLRSLQQCSRKFPAALRQRPAGPGGNREVTVGNVHVAGAYYFGVILVTRQFLVQMMIPRLRDTSTSAQKKTQQDSRTDGLAADLSQACVEAAAYMAQTCHQAMDSGGLLGNMCIVKAWVFAAGLVLGFSLLTEDQDSAGGRDAFHKSLDVLQKLGQLSPQARQYHQILANFSEAIEQYKERLQQRRRVPRASLVDCIFSPAPVENEARSSDTPPAPAPPDVMVPHDDLAAWLAGDGVVAAGEVLNEQQWLALGDDDIIIRLFWDGQVVQY